MIVLSTLVGIMNTVNALQVPRIGAPDYTYPELGNPHVPGAMSFDDQDLVAGRGANRRINRVDLWCGDYVYQMIPFYRGAAGKVDEVSRMYGSNVKNGKWTQLALEDGEYIGGAVYQTCDTSVGNRLCYLQLYKFRDVIGRRYPKFTGTVGCGQPDGPNHGKFSSLKYISA